MMAVIAPTPVPTASRAEFPEKTLLAALALTSFSALLLELALTRLFSVVLFYHFAFLSISIALLGLGAGGVFAYLLKARLASLSTRSVASRLCLANSVIVLVVLEIVLHVPVALNLTGKNFLRLTLLYLSAAVPFFLIGLLFSIVFARENTPHTETLRRGPLWRRSRLPCHRAPLELAWRPKRNHRSGRCFGCLGNRLGRESAPSAETPR